jgi:hypothetical protein
MNKTNRYYFKDDPYDTLSGTHVLESVSVTSVESMFRHLQENPLLLCDRSMELKEHSEAQVSFVNHATKGKKVDGPK